MDFATALKSYLEVGCLGLAAISLILLFIFLVKKLTTGHEKSDTFTQNQLSQLINILSTQNNDLFKQANANNQVLIDSMVKAITNHTPTVEENKQLTKVSEKLDMELQEILAETNGSRCSIVQFHNGGKGINKQSFLKMSATNEQVRSGVKPLMCQLKDQFRGVLSNFTRDINNEGKCYIPDINEIKEQDATLYEFMYDRGIEAQFGIGIENDENMTIVFVLLEFVNKSKADLDNIIEVLNDKKKIIKYLLNIQVH